MIKDYGGFQKLDMSNTPKMKFIDLDARARDEAREAATYAFELKINTDIAKELAIKKEISDNILQKLELAKNIEKEKEDDDSGYSNSSSGPMMM